MTPATYIVALGSNRHGRHGSPVAEVVAALTLLDPLATSPIASSAPLGPSLRRYANAVAVVADTRDPPAFLALLKAIERDFGRRAGRRWGARVLDLDIVLWSGGIWADAALAIPHPAFRHRGFVLAPLARLAPGWRDPLTGRTARQLAARLTRAKRLPRRGRRVGEGP
ncbi:MAG: 2-amino-4-hydroxy-6-hydroxymethyldihydropteridine diphosphokinase [Pseudomonadota bacterium]